MPVTVRAVDRTWAGTGTTNFNTASNWTPSGVPGPTDVLTLFNTSTSTSTASITSSTTVAQVNIGRPLSNLPNPQTLYSNVNLNIAPGTTLTTDVFEYRGGTVSGTINTRVLRTPRAADGMGGGAFNFSAPNSSVEGYRYFSSFPGDPFGRWVIYGGAILGGMNANYTLAAGNSAGFFGFEELRGTATIGSSPANATSSISLASSTVSVSGTLNLIAGSTSAAPNANERLFSSRFFNDGTTTVQPGVLLRNTGSATSDVLNNRGTFNLNGTARLTVPFEQTSGQLNINSTTGRLETNTFIFRGGTINGTLYAKDVQIAPGLTSAATVVLTSSSASVAPTPNPVSSLEIPSGMSLLYRMPAFYVGYSLDLKGSPTNRGVITLESEPTTVSAYMTLSVSGRFTNHGTINLNGGSTSTDARANLRSVFATIDNTGTGRINIGAGARIVTYTGTAPWSNSGVMSINGALELDNALRQDGGTIEVNPSTGRLQVPNFTLAGGSIVGSVDTQTVTVDPTFTGAATLRLGRLRSSSIRASGGLQQVAVNRNMQVFWSPSSGETIDSFGISGVNEGTVWIDAWTANPAAVANLYLVDNRGMINIGRNRAPGLQSFTLSLPATVINRAGATINIAPGVRLQASQGILTNDGVLNLGASLQLPTGSYNYGTINIGSPGDSTPVTLQMPFNQWPQTQIVNNNSFLIGGNWTVFGNGRLDSTSGPWLTSVFNANLTLDGAGASFPALGSFISNIGSLTVRNGATASVRGDFTNTGTLVVGVGSKLTLATTTTQRVARFATFTLDGTLDLGSGALIIDTGNWASRVASGYGNGTWNGVGIVSLRARTDSRYAVGYATADQLFGPSVPGMFQGKSVVGDDSLFLVTLAGDANLSGIVDFTDLLLLAQSYGSSARTWATGDFNYDGSVNFTDLLALAQNYGQAVTGSLESDWALARSIVPEPAGMILVAGSVLILRRRASC
jgi:hypothetical protein